MTAVERYGPPIGSEVYEKLRADFQPMNPPVDEWILNSFVVPMPPQEFNLPQVAVTVEWTTDSGVEEPEQHAIEHFIKNFYARATIQGVVDDVSQIEVYRFSSDSDDPMLALTFSLLVEPVIRGGTKRFENDFEKLIFMHKTKAAFGPLHESIRLGLYASRFPRFEADFPTVESRLQSYQFPATLLATARLRTEE